MLAHAPPHEPSAREPRAYLLGDSFFQTIQPSFQHADLHMITQIRTAKILSSRLFATFRVLRRRGIRGLTACWFCRVRRRIRLSAYWRCGWRWRTTGPSRLRKRRHAQRCRRGHNNHKTHVYLLRNRVAPLHYNMLLIQRTSGSRTRSLIPMPKKFVSLFNDPSYLAPVPWDQAFDIIWLFDAGSTLQRSLPFRSPLLAQ